MHSRSKELSKETTETSSSPGKKIVMLHAIQRKEKKGHHRYAYLWRKTTTEKNQTPGSSSLVLLDPEILLLKTLAVWLLKYSDERTGSARK